MTKERLLSEMAARKLCNDGSCDCDPPGGHVPTSLMLLFRFIDDKQIEDVFWDSFEW